MMRLKLKLRRRRRRAKKMRSPRYAEISEQICGHLICKTTMICSVYHTYSCF